jgi:alkaline phosphatase
MVDITSINRKKMVKSKMDKKYKKILSLILAIAVISVSVIAFPVASRNNDVDNQKTWGPTLENQNIKNVIVMVPDGCSQSIQTAARWFKGEPLYLDQIVTGTVATWMSDSIITDSASAATAFATGYKTTDGFISVGPTDGSDTPKNDEFLTGFESTATPYDPLATVLEGAKLTGKSTGLVATSRITHATPAAYAAHTESRNYENEIMEQMVYQDIDVVFGGGKRHLYSSRTDGENLIDDLITRGYQFVETQSEMNTVTSGKVWGMFANSHMEAEIDRAEFAPEQPSLAEMTEKAIELLSQDKDGFFLMVEGSQVDWAGHANDPVYMVTDFLAFDEAVGVALNFAKKDGKTLLMAFPDHNTGGMSIGSYYQDTNAISHGYTDLTIEDLIDPLLGMQITSTGLVKKLSELGPSPTNDEIKAVFSQWWGLDITDFDIAAMNLADSYAISEYISKAYTAFGWTTHGHVGDDVPLWAYGPKDTAPGGHYDNTELAMIVADVLGFSLDIIDQRLFVNVADEFEATEWEINDSDPSNLVLEITVNGKETGLPASKDLLISDGSEIELEGIVVYIPMCEEWFIPQQAIDYLK